MVDVEALEAELESTRLRLAREMLRHVYVPGGTEVWMRARHPEFGYRTAKELIRAGEQETVYATIERLITGAFA